MPIWLHSLFSEATAPSLSRVVCRAGELINGLCSGGTESAQEAKRAQIERRGALGFPLAQETIASSREQRDSMDHGHLCLPHLPYSMTFVGLSRTRLAWGHQILEIRSCMLNLLYKTCREKKELLVLRILERYKINYEVSRMFPDHVIRSWGNHQRVSVPGNYTLLGRYPYDSSVIDS